MKKMKDYFDEEAVLHDELFIQKMGLSEFYDSVELAVNACNPKEDILVLGCGSGLEIERIKFPCNVVGLDISEKMLEVLRKKKLSEGVKLTTVCVSFLDMNFAENKYDIVLSCYAMHHFNAEQKQLIYNKIYSCLKDSGVFINGDFMVADPEEEERFLKEAEQIYQAENMPFASLHIDVPFCWEHEKEVMKSAGFSDVKRMKEWSNTKLIRGEKRYEETR